MFDTEYVLRHSIDLKMLLYYDRYSFKKWGFPHSVASLEFVRALSVNFYSPTTVGTNVNHDAEITVWVL